MSIYELTVKDINNKEKNLNDFKGKPALIVNVASKCGLTPHYEGLQKLFDKYENLQILGFPCNQFGKQEPGSNEEIIDFCSSNYGVTFPMFDKIEVKGTSISPVYQYLNEQANEEPKWNFHKYLVDSEGNFVASFGSRTEPFDEALIKKIEELL